MLWDGILLSYKIRPASLSGLLPSSPAPLVSGWRLHQSIGRKEKFPVPSEKEEWGIIAQRLQTLSTVTNTVERQG